MGKKFNQEPESVSVSVEEVRHGVQYRKKSNSKPSEAFIQSVKATNGPICLIKTRDAWEDKGEDPAYYYIIDGHLRFQASCAAGINHIAVEHYGDISEGESNIIAAITNVARKSLTRGEQKVAVLDLSSLGHSERYIAELLSMGRQTVADILDIHESGTSKVKKAVDTGSVSTAVAGRVAQLPKKHQNTALSQVEGKNAVEGRQTIAQIRKSLNIPACLRAPKIDLPDPNWHEKKNRPIRYQKNYPVHTQFKLLLQDFEWLTKNHLSDFPMNETFRAFKEAIRLMKGEIDMGDIFPGYGHIQPGGRKKR